MSYELETANCTLLYPEKKVFVRLELTTFTLQPQPLLKFPHWLTLTFSCSSSREGACVPIPNYIRLLWSLWTTLCIQCSWYASCTWDCVCIKELGSCVVTWYVLLKDWNSSTLILFSSSTHIFFTSSTHILFTSSAHTLFTSSTTVFDLGQCFHAVSTLAPLETWFQLQKSLSRKQTSFAPPP